MLVEDELVHWWKDEKNEQHRTIIRLEREDAQNVNGFPRDGTITIRVLNTTGKVAIRLSPDESLRLSTQLLAVAKDLLNQKRRLWQAHED